MFHNRIDNKSSFLSIMALFILIGIGLLGIFSIPGCKMNRTTMGYPDKIYVFADSSVWKEVRKPIRDKFEGEILTPGSEKKFNIIYVPLNLLHEFKARMNLFFVGLQNSPGQVNKYLDAVLPDKFKEGVKENRYFYLYQDDLFAEGQIGLFMYARDLSTFKTDFKYLQDQIYHTFEKKYYARLKKDMFDSGEQKDIEKYIAQNFGFTIRVQHDYFVAIQDKPKRFIWLRRFDPDRWVSLWKIKGDSSLMTFDKLADIRDQYTKKYYEGDYIVRDDSYLTLDTLNGQKTYKMVGIWRNDSVFVGGPFRTFVVHHPADSSLYFVDIAVMGPRYKKKPYLDQLEVIAHTFRIVDDKMKK